MPPAAPHLEALRRHALCTAGHDLGVYIGTQVLRRTHKVHIRYSLRYSGVHTHKVLSLLALLASDKSINI